MPPPSTPPTLGYAAPPPPIRGITFVFVLLLLIGTFYISFGAIFSYGLITDSSLNPFACTFVPVTAISAALFFTAAIQIRRRSRRWALIAFITTLTNLAALFTCLGFAIHSSPDIGGAFACMFSILPFTCLTILALNLRNLLDDLNYLP